MVSVNAIMQQRRDTAANLAAENAIYADGELVFESDTLRIKIGNGVTAYNSISYMTVDAASVAASGALMDSEVANLAQVKAFDSSDYATAAQGVLADSAQQPPTEGAFVDGDKTKLDGIEAIADVTDTANVTAAGALMDSELTDEAAVKALAARNFASRSALVTAASGATPPAGTIWTADGLEYERDSAATLLPDLAGWKPAGRPDIRHFGAVGNPAADDTADIDSALAAYDRLYVPDGVYHVTALSNYTFGKQFYGPGVIAASTEFQTPYFGSTYVAGVKIGNTYPVENHGGFLVGGGGGGTPHGTMLKAQSEGIVDFIPTRTGDPLEVQLYSAMLQGYGDFTSTTFDATVSVGGTFSDSLYVNDLIWFNDTQYRVSSISDSDTLIVKNVDGTAASTPSDTTSVFWSGYHHKEMTADLASGVLTWTAGDPVEDLGDDHNVIINGTRYEVSSIDTGAGTITISSPPADDTDLTVLFRFNPSEEYISLFRWQVLRGTGKEMTVSHFVRPDAAGFRIGCTGYGSDSYAYFVPWTIMCGMNSGVYDDPADDDAMIAAKYTALYVDTANGNVGIGNQRSPEAPVDAKRDWDNVNGADNVTKTVANFRTIWQGAGERRVSVVARNDYGSPGFQAYNNGTGALDLRLQPEGGGVVIGDWATATSGCTLDVRGGNVRAGDGTWDGEHIQLGSYHLWVDSTGDLRIKASAPSSDTDGTIVGAQT